MPFIKLKLSSELSKERIQEFIINTNFIVSIVDTNAEPIMYWTDNGFEKSTTVSIVNDITFQELCRLLDCKEKDYIYDPLA